jgi:hypothetical protein
MTIVIDGTTGISGVDGTASNPSYEGTDSNTGIFYPAADTVAIATGGTEKVRVNNSGTVSVTGSVDVTRSGGTVSTLTQTSATGYGLTIIPGADTTYQALTINNAANTLNNIAMYGNGTAMFAKTIGVGGAAPSLSGAGITFPATQSASSDANTLDDYEEGTWTPSIGGTATYAEQNGRYTKIGRVVIVEYTLSITTRGTGSTTDISGLPFAISSNIQASGLLSYYANLAVNVLGISAYGFNASVFRFYGRDTAGVSANGPLGIFGNGAYIQGNLIYYTT